MNFNFLKLTFYSLIVFFGLRWFLFNGASNKTDISQLSVDLPGEEFRAPASKLESMPVIRDVDFYDNEKSVDSEAVILYTKNCDYFFSSQGAVLSGVEFKKHKNEHGMPVRTIYPQGYLGGENGAFFLALNEKTPFYYSVESQGQNEQGESWVTFKTENSQAKIRKTFIAKNENYLLELKLEIYPKDSTLQPRIIFAGPRVVAMTEEKNSALVLDIDGVNFAEISKEKESSSAWKLPQIFGAQNQYFLNAFLVQGQSDFVQRAFIKRINEHDVLCYVEGREISEPTKATLNFYVGTKSLEELKAVDSRLVGLLNFGFMSLVCEWMIKVLEYLAALVGNYGFAIILLALCYRLLILPFNFFIRRRFNDAVDFDLEHASEIRAIKKEFKSDWAKQTEALDNFYKKYGRSSMQKSINALSLVFVVPLFIAAYKIFGSYINFYNAPFVLWLKDLSGRDPYMVMPILFGGSTLLREMVSGEPSQKTFNFGKLFAPMLLVFFFRNSPVGLTLFMLSDSLFTSLETFLLDLVLRGKRA